MRNPSASLALALLAITSCHAPGTKSAPAAAAPARLASDVGWLADDAREGRRAGTTQGLESAKWLAQRFRDLDLEPAGEKDTFFQDFDVPLEPRSGGASYLQAAAPLDSFMPPSWRLDEARGAVVPLFCSDRGTVSGTLVWCGYGIEAPDVGWNDYAAIDPKGEIAVIVRGTPKRPDLAPKEPAAEASAPSPHGDTAVTAHDPFANAALVFTKVMTAKRRGAKAVVLVQHPDDEASPLLAFGRGGEARAGIPCLTLRWSDAKKALGPSLGELSETKPASPVANPRVATVEADVRREHGPARNVLATLRGLDRSRAILVGAHYDHLGFGGTGSLAPNERAIHNGADDNASGSAAVLEIARLLSGGPPPMCDVVFALWSGEELGLLGSERWAEQPTRPLAEIECVLNLDMVGRANNGKLQVLAAGTAAPFAGWLAEAGPRAGLDLTVSTSGNMMGGSSDHATFLKRKIPALHFFSGLHADYHKPTDDADKFEAEGAAKVADLVADLARRACAVETLAFVEPPPDPSSKGEIKSGFSAWFGSIPNYTWDKPGVLIDGTSSGSPAERAGFQKGDVLLKVGDVELGSIYDFTYALQLYKPGDVVLVAFERDGKREEQRVTLASRGVR